MTRRKSTPGQRSGVGGGRLRIIGGEFRNRYLLTLPDRRVRPMPERMREALFNALAVRDLLDGAHVLDAFAGSGALGMEAVSRGASHATFTERDRGVYRQLQANIASLLGDGEEGAARATAWNLDVLADGADRLPRWLGPPPALATGDAGNAARPLPPTVLILLDPPYDLLREEHYEAFCAAADRLVTAIAPPGLPAVDDAGNTSPTVTIVLGHDHDVQVPDAIGGREREHTRAYGRTHLSWYGFV